MEYSRAANQTITNAAVNLPTDAHYQNLSISGSGIKTARGATTINQMINIISGTMDIPATADDTAANVITSKGGVTVQTGGIFILENNAQLMRESPAVDTGNINVERIATKKIIR